MSVNVVQTATGTNGGAGTATTTLGVAPTAGNKLLFLVSYAGSSTVTPPAGLILKSTHLNDINNSSAAAKVYYRDVLPGDASAWGFTDGGNWVSVIIYELSGAALGDAFDAPPTWGFGSQTPAIDGQPTYTPTTNATGGLAISFTAEDSNYTTTTQDGSWTNLKSATSTYHSGFASQQSATPSVAMPAAWSVTGSDTYWIGTVFVIRQSAVYVVQTASAYNGGSGTAQLTFGSTPTPGNKLLFFISYPGYALPTVPSNLILKSTGTNGINNASASARIYYRDVRSGDANAWPLTFIGSDMTVIGYELSGTASGDNFDAAPVWSSEQHTPAIDGQPSSIPSVNASGGLTFSFLTEDFGYTTASQGGGWTNTITQVGGSYHPSHVSVQVSTPSVAMPAAWSVTGAGTFWTGVVFTLKQNFGIGSPSADAGLPKGVPALSSFTLNGTDTTAPGHAASVAWTAITPSAPAITSGANTLTATIANSGAPQIATYHTYQLTITQDDTQNASSTVTIMVLPASRFIAHGSTWVGMYPGKRSHGGSWV